MKYLPTNLGNISSDIGILISKYLLFKLKTKPIGTPRNNNNILWSNAKMLNQSSSHSHLKILDRVLNYP